MQTAYSLNLNILNTSMYSAKNLRESKRNVLVMEIIAVHISCRFTFYHMKSWANLGVSRNAPHKQKCPPLL